MTDTVRVPRGIYALGFDHSCGGFAAIKVDGQEVTAARLRAMLAASPQGEGDCVCVQRGDGPEGCGLCNETGVVTHPASPQGEGSSADADTHRAAEGAVLADMTSALNPFAAMIGHIEDWMDDDYCPSWSPFIPVAAYRKARAAMIAYHVTEVVTPPASPQGEGSLADAATVALSDMREIAIGLGYESILEALEDLDRLKSVTHPAEPQWIKHDGGPNPVPGKRLDALVSGSLAVSKNLASDDLQWEHTGGPFDILSYRVTEGVKP